MYGNNLVEIIVTSSDEQVQKIYTIETYRRTREETEIYNQNQELDREKVKEILGDVEDIDESYIIERTSTKVSYKSDNNTIKVGILSVILVFFIIAIIMKNIIGKK